MRRKMTLWGIVGICAMAMGTSASGVTVLFSDSFEGDTPGVKTSLNNWTVTRGDVDVLPQSALGLGGSDQIIDLAGNVAGRMESRQAFTLEPGLYTLSFDVAGSQRASSPLDVVRVLFGDEVLVTSTRYFQDQFQGITVQLNPTETTSGRIVFDQQTDAWATSQGVLIDNVILRDHRPSGGPVPIPVPAAIWTGMATMAGLGAMQLIRRRGHG